MNTIVSNVCDLLAVSLVLIRAFLMRMKGSVGLNCCRPERNRLLTPGDVSSKSGGDNCIFKQLQDSRVGRPQTFQAMHCDR